MKYEIVLTSEAASELQESIIWYNNKVKGLGSKFLLNIEAAIESISRAPMSYPKVYKNIRRALIRKFPFGIHYIIENEQVIVIAVFHVSRNPMDISSRKRS